MRHPGRLLPLIACCLLAATGAVSTAAPSAAQGLGLAAQALPSDDLEDYRALLVALGGQALGSSRLDAPMPCLPHWVAGADHVIVAVSAPGAIAGLRTGDRLIRIGGSPVGGSSGAPWDAVLRRLPADTATYTVDTGRARIVDSLTLPCAPSRAMRQHRAERAMWTAITRRDWTTCVAHGHEMLDAFGARMSPPLMVMTRCAAARGDRDPSLTAMLAEALLDEWAAHPEPSPDDREQLLATVRELELLSRDSGVDYAGPIRARMDALGISTGR